MKKINYLLLLTILVTIAFHACKTKQKIIDEGKNAVINNTTENSTLTDTTLYIYSKEDIDKIRKQIPEDKEIMDIPNIYFLLENIYDQLYSSGGSEFADKYIDLYKKYGRKATNKEIAELKLKGKMPLSSEEFARQEEERRKKEKELLLKRIKTGEKFSEGTGGTFQYQKINSEQPILNKTLPNVEFYNYYSNATKSNSIKLFYNNEIIGLKGINRLFYQDNYKSSLNDQIKCLIILFEDDMTLQPEILSISEASVAWNFQPHFIFNKKATIKIDNEEYKYYLIIENMQLRGIAKIGINEEAYQVQIIQEYIK